MNENIYLKAHKNNPEAKKFWKHLGGNMSRNKALQQNLCDKCSNATLPLQMKHIGYCSKCKEFSLVGNVEIYIQAILIRGFNIQIWGLGAPKIFKKESDEK